MVTDGGERLTLAALRRELADDPERGSWSVLLRPAVQDYLLPTAAFIVGPGEASYLAQVQPFQAALGLPRPVLLPRSSATLVEPRVAGHLESYGLDVPDAWVDLDQLTSRVAREQTGPVTEQLFAAARTSLDAAFEPLRAHSTAVDATLGATADGALNRTRAELDKLEGKVHKALKQRDETLQRRLALVHRHLFPDRGLQERRLNVASFAARFGPSVVAELVDALEPLEPGLHAVARIA